MELNLEDWQPVERLYPGTLDDQVRTLTDWTHERLFELAQRMTAMGEMLREEIDRVGNAVSEVARVEERLIQHVMRAEAQMVVGVRERDEALRQERERVLVLMLGQIIEQIPHRDRLRFADRLRITLDHYGFAPGNKSSISA